MFDTQALQFDKCDGLQITELTHINGPGPHIAVTDSQDVTISHIHINSPKDSHNSDVIDLTRAIRVNVHDIPIRSGKNILIFFPYTSIIKLVANIND
jgi:polygalacturonase